jgi:hypothetical protein
MAMTPDQNIEFGSTVFRCHCGHDLYVCWINLLTTIVIKRRKCHVIHQNPPPPPQQTNNKNKDNKIRILYYIQMRSSTMPSKILFPWQHTNTIIKCDCLFNLTSDRSPSLCKFIITHKNNWKEDKTVVSVNVILLVV